MPTLREAFQSTPEAQWPMIVSFQFSVSDDPGDESPSSESEPVLLLSDSRRVALQNLVPQGNEWTLVSMTSVTTDLLSGRARHRDGRSGDFWMWLSVPVPPPSG